jgi:hypothetical protein
MPDLDDDLQTVDPRKAVIHAGVAHILRALLTAMYSYCHGPQSTRQIEAQLGGKLIECGRLLRSYGSQVARGSAGDVGEGLQ